MKSYLLGTAAVVLFMATPAFSDCTPLMPDDGDTITCTGTDTDGVNQTLIDNGNLDDIRLDVTGTLSNADSGEHTVELDDDATIVISSTGRVEDVSGAHAIKLDEAASIENAGLIQGGKDGLNLGVNAVVHNAASGSIFGGDDAIQAEDGLEVQNHGTIFAEDEGLNAGDNAIVFNDSNASISAKDDAIKVGVNAVITNYGLIENIGKDTADPQDAIDMDQGRIENFGTIVSTLDAAIDFDAGTFAASTIVNGGTISGTYGILTDPENDAGQIVRNSGVITGTSGTAMDLGLGDDTVEMAGFSAITGDILFGEGMDRLVIDGLTGAFSGAVDFGNGDDVFEVAGLSLMDGDWMFDEITEIYGGAGTDTLSFSIDFATFLNEVTVSVLDAVTYALSFGDAPAQLVFTDFETLRFSDGSYAMSDLAPVPLPAGLWLMLSGLGGFVALRRRRTSVA